MIIIVTDRFDTVLVGSEGPVFRCEISQIQALVNQGTTLIQETLAPRDVRFYSAGWKFLITRKDLKDLALSITKIPVKTLAGEEFQPHTRSISEVISWASMREIAIEEDTA
jgi:hypothetical protein